MQICAEETGVADTVDPLAVSYFVETLTNEMEARIRAEMERVERMGGIVESIKSGAIQAEVARQAYRFEQMMVSGEYPKVGGEPPRRPGEQSATRRTPSSSTRSTRESPRRRSPGSDGSAASGTRAPWTSRSRACATAPAGRDNLMPPILEAVRAYATLGEMAGALRDVWGEHKEPTAF